MDLKTVLKQLEDEKREHYETKMKLQRCEDRLQTQKDYQTLYEEQLKTIRELEESLAVRNTKISQLIRMKTDDSISISRLSARNNHLECELNLFHQEDLRSKIELRESQIGKLFEALKNMKQSLKEAEGYIEELKSMRFSLEMRIHAMENKEKREPVEKIHVSLDESSDDDDEEEEEEDDEEVLRKIFAAEPPRPTEPPVRVQPNPLPPVVRDPSIGSPSQMMESTFDADVARVEIPSDSAQHSYSSGEEDALQRLLNERRIVKPILKKRILRFAGFKTFEEQKKSGSRKRVRFSM